MNKVQAIAKQSIANLSALFGEMESDIKAAILAATEEAQTNDRDSIKLTLSHSITLDLAKNIQSDKLSVAVKHTGEMSGFMVDPSQPELDLE